MRSSSRNANTCFVFLAVGVIGSYATAFADAPEFSEIVINAGFKVQHPILVGDLDKGSSRHLVLAGQDDNHEQRIAVYRIDVADSRGAVLVASIFAEPQLIAYDIGRFADHDELMFIVPGRILRYDLNANEFSDYMQVSSFYRQTRTGGILPLDFFRDINDDELDDLILPDISGYRIRLQREDGTLGRETLLEDSVIMRLSGGTVRFDGRSLFSGDMDFDGLVDLGFWRGDALGIYYQQADLLYREQPQVRSSGLDVLTEDEKRALQAGLGAVDQKGLTEKDIQSVNDLNGDKIPDIMIEATFSEGMFDRRNEFSLHLGRQDGSNVVYDRSEDALLASEGLQFGLISTDIDGDGKLDLIVRKAKLSFGRLIRALFSGTVPLEIQFYRMNEYDSYPEEANFVARTKVRFSRSRPVRVRLASIGQEAPSTKIPR